jgi:hypothetical protein
MSDVRAIVLPKLHIENKRNVGLLLIVLTGQGQVSINCSIASVLLASCIGITNSIDAARYTKS